MKARVVFHEKRLVWSTSLARVGIAEVKVWEVPRSVDYPEARKFSLFFSVEGEVLVGIDNHKPKGPHLHIHGEERPFETVGEGRLLAAFWDLVRQEGFEP